MPKKHTQNPVVSIARLLKTLGKEEHIVVEVEPTWKHVGRILKRNNTYSYFRGAHFDLNGLGSTEIAIDKAYTHYFLKKSGFHTINTKTFFSQSFSKKIYSTYTARTAYAYAKKIGFPVVVKPNTASQGRLVCVAHNQKTFFEAVKHITQIDRVFLVQPLVSGHDYRVVVLNNEVLSAYERLPLTVTGDGISTIHQLITKKQKQFITEGRDTHINADDFRITNKLARLGYTKKTVLPAGESCALLDNRNLSTGGDSIDVTTTIDPTYKQLAVEIVRTMGLSYCGIDLMVQHSITQPFHPKTNTYTVIELNAAPGVDHYAKSGPAQKKNVKEMYRKVLKAIYTKT